MKVLIGEPIVMLATGHIFKVLCSCPGSMPREHTKRFIEQNPTLYRHPTHEEITQWQSGMSQGTSA